MAADPLAQKVAFVGVLLAGMAVLAACTSTAAQSNAAPPSALPPTSSSSTSLPPATTAAPAQPTTPPAPVTASYDAARTQWQAGATAISAQQGNYWSQAANDLTAGEATDTNPTGYADAVTALKELISLPDAQQTAAQNARYHADINALNAFFNTPGLYS
jgi:hypothetical protein